MESASEFAEISMHGLKGLQKELNDAKQYAIIYTSNPAAATFFQYQNHVTVFEMQK